MTTPTLKAIELCAKIDGILLPAGWERITGHDMNQRFPKPNDASHYCDGWFFWVPLGAIVAYPYVCLQQGSQRMKSVVPSDESGGFGGNSDGEFFRALDIMLAETKL